MRKPTAVVVLILLASACADRDVARTILADRGEADRNVELESEFRSACSILATQRVGNSKHLVEAGEGWLLVEGELRYLAAGSYVGDNAPRANPKAPPDRADPVPAIVDFNRQLAERGIELYVVPVPVRAAIYPETVLGPERLADLERIPNLDWALRELVSALREQGVRVVDLAPLFLEHRTNREQRALFCPSDPHWTPYGISLAAQALAAEISDRPWYKDVPKQGFRYHWMDYEHSGRTYRLLAEETGMTREPDVVPARRITFETGDPPETVPMQNPGSPVIVIGDSNTLWWKRLSSSLPQQLAYELGFPVDTMSTKGGGTNETRLNLARRLQADPDFLEGKQAVIWAFSARSFTNDPQGWILIPL